MSDSHVSVVALERHELVSDKPFDDVLAAVHSGLGRPNFGEFEEHLAHLTDWDTFKTAVADQAGSSGLLVFLELDLGSVVDRDPDAVGFRAVRVIAGNPVTMESMVRTSPAAGAFAPVTILIFERDDGVHLRYDTLMSGTDGELTDEAREHASALDNAVLALLQAAV
jgi:uncharacterized protein (DUF302 family)